MTCTGDSSKATQNASYRASNEIHILLFFLMFYLTAFLYTPAGGFCKDVMLKDSHWNQAQKCLSGGKKKVYLNHNSHCRMFPSSQHTENQ